MPKMITFGSSSSGDISGFERWIREWDQQVSFTLDDGFHFDDTSYFKVLHQVEPPEVLDVVDRVIKNHEFYDLILAWNKRILEACPNAVLFPQATCTWMNPEYRPWDEGVDAEGIDAKLLLYKAVMRPDYKPVRAIECDTRLKKFQVSFLTSSKAFTPGHRLRQEIYERLPDSINGTRIYKHRSPPYLSSKRELLDEYQYIITPQNASHDNWFDDKIVDALMAKTIPLFWGCPNIGEFFNMDGILHFETYEELVSMLERLTPDYYEAHFPAVQDNFERALKLVHVWHRAEVEINKGIERKKQQGVAMTTSAPSTRRFLRRR